MLHETQLCGEIGWDFQIRSSSKTSSYQASFSHTKTVLIWISSTTCFSSFPFITSWPNWSLWSPLILTLLVETNIFTSDPTEMATLTPELNWNHNRTTISFFNITRVSEACPPPIGIASSQGCNKNFMEDVNGNIPCQDDFDCPENKEWFY